VVGEHLGVEAIGYSAITKLGVDKIVQKIERALS